VQPAASFVSIGGIHYMSLSRSACVLAVSLAGTAMPAAAQRLQGHVMGQALPSVITAGAVPGGGSATEVTVLQPILMGDLAWGRALRGRMMLDFEGVTMPAGELAMGGWGEGFVDRRHPHTYLHEAMVWGSAPLGGADARVAGGLAVGKGIVPFGTDDPMSRPFVRFPVNHHLAQIIERAEIATGWRIGFVGLEGAIFNGDEPERPGQWPSMGRFADSWATRLTVWPVRGLEVQGSFASVNSPEHRAGAGLDQAKWSASARMQRVVARTGIYGLVEWARTEEGDNAFVFASVLAEASVLTGRHRFGYRIERTGRPEEERFFDNPFRSPRPLLDNSIVGQTRWTLHTFNYALQFALVQGKLGVQPFVEVTVGQVSDIGAGLFQAAALYGTNDVRGLTVGMRLDFGGAMGRMGRYGAVAVPDEQVMDAIDGHTH
jgi:hypothetical protein